MLAELILVMLVDTGFNKTTYTKHEVVTDSEDLHNHGTSTTNVLLYGDEMLDPLCKQVKVVMCTAFPVSGRKIGECLKKARQQQIKYVNVSISGGILPDKDEIRELNLLLKGGAYVTYAAGNDRIDLDKDKRYPQSLKMEGLYVVGAFDVYSSNTGKNVHFRQGVNYTYNSFGEYQVVRGTSFAAPNFLREFLKKECNKGVTSGSDTTTKTKDSGKNKRPITRAHSEGSYGCGNYGSVPCL